MKVLIIYIRGGGGCDTYFRLLKESLDKYTDIESDLILLPHYLEKLFFLIPIYLKLEKINFDQYDVIHTVDEFGWWFRKKNKILSLVVLHYALDEENRKQMSSAQKIFYTLWVKPNLKKSLRIADKILAISRYSKDSISRNLKIKKHIDAIYPGLEGDLYKPDESAKKRDRKKKILLFVGNLTKRKGADMLPRIMEKLGDGYELRFTCGLRTKMPKNLAGKNMIPLNRITDEELASEYNKCDVLVSPSRLEGFGYSVAEAMLCEKPVVVTDHSSYREIVENGKHGYLCRINDADDFADKIKKMAERLNRGENFSNNREHILKNFSSKKMADKCEEYFKNNKIK